MPAKRYLALAISALVFNPALGAVNNDVYIGTWSTTPTGAAATQGLKAGGRYVLKSTYDTATIQQVNRGGVTFFSANLNPSDHPSNSFDSYIPLQGPNTIDHQIAADHYLDPSIPNQAPTAEIQFFDLAGTKFRGIEFESQVLPNRTTGPLIFEQFAENTTRNYGSGPITVTNSRGQILDSTSFNLLANSITSDVLTKDTQPLAQGGSGGVAFPGVFLSKAVPVVADAGTALTWNASNFATTKTTNGGTAVVTDMPAAIDTSGNTVRTPAMALTGSLTRQADNNLGAARTDKQDFLNFVWNVNGSNVNGSLDGVRQHNIGLVPDATGVPAHFVDNGARTVSNVNVNVSLAASGILHPNDVKNIGLTVTEDMTGLSGSANTTATYTNAAPTSVSGNNLNFDAANLTKTETVQASDVDRAVNATIANFESTKLDLNQDVNQVASFTDTGSAVALAHDFAVTLAQSGLTNTLDTKTLTIQATDFAGASASGTVTASYANALPIIPTFTATAQGTDFLFSLYITDADLVANTVVAGFEDVQASLFHNGILINDPTFNNLLQNSIGGSGSTALLTDAMLFNLFGSGTVSLEVRATDRFLRNQGANSFISSSVSFNVTNPTQSVPEPSSLLIFGTGLAALVGTRRRKLG